MAPIYKVGAKAGKGKSKVHKIKRPPPRIADIPVADLLPTVTTLDRVKQHANKLFKDQGNDLRSLGQAFTSTSILQFWFPT